MYTLRLATDEDFDFLYDLHKVTMQEYVHATWGWDEVFQLQMFKTGFNDPPLSIVIVDGQDNGVVRIEARADDVYLHTIEIHPRVQRRGIGAAIVRSVIEQAVARGVPSALRVIKANVGARRLYQRLGFVVVAESETHYDMRCG
jgi:ribosomal protein S18 acetylase RimI-like enzyme